MHIPVSYDCLQSFITSLESHEELARVSPETDPVLEIAAVTDRVCKSPGGGKALLFEKPSDSNFPVATNLFGSERRVCLALGIDHLDRLTERLSALLDRIPVVDFDRISSQLAALPEFSCYAPYALAEPDPNLMTMDPPDLMLFPFLQSWPEDGSASGNTRYITLPQVFTVDPDGDTPNCGLYRIQVRGALELGIQWKTGSGAARHAESYKKEGKPIPVAIALGGDPSMLFSAMFPLPGDLDEVTFAGFLRGSPLQSAPGHCVPISVPTGAEVVIEGYVNPRESVMEGPFGNHTGFCSPAAPAALMRVTAIRHRRNAIIPATVVGPAPMEDCWMAKAWERLLLAFVRKLVPSVIDIHFPFEWIFHQSAVISLDSLRPGMVSDIAGQLWALPWFAAARIMIFVDAKSKQANLSYAVWRCINLVDGAEEIIRDKTAHRIAIDATGCRSLRTDAEMPDEVIKRVDSRWQEFGLA